MHLISKKNVQIKDKNWKRYNLFWNYKSFDIHVFDEGKYLAPVITRGEYVEKTAEQHFHFRLHRLGAGGSWRLYALRHTVEPAGRSLLRLVRGVAIRTAALWGAWFNITYKFINLISTRRPT